MASQKLEYVPGVCNIGAAETAQRRTFGWIGLGVTVVLWAIFVVFGVGAPWRLFLLLPAAGSASGFLQAAFHFCANFGMRGVFNFGPEVGKADTVEQAEFRLKDRRKAQTIIVLSLLIGIAVAVVGYFTAR